MLYKPGDRVVVRDDMKVEEYYCNKDNEDAAARLVKPMNDLAGKTVTIYRIASASIDRKFYRIDADGGMFFWSDNMFYGLEEEVLGEDIEQSSQSIMAFISR